MMLKINGIVTGLLLGITIVKLIKNKFNYGFYFIQGDDSECESKT